MPTLCCMQPHGMSIVFATAMGVVMCIALGGVSNMSRRLSRGPVHTSECPAAITSLSPQVLPMSAGARAVIIVTYADGTVLLIPELSVAAFYRLASSSRGKKDAVIAATGGGEDAHAPWLPRRVLNPASAPITDREGVADAVGGSLAPLRERPAVSSASCLTPWRESADRLMVAVGFGDNTVAIWALPIETASVFAIR